MVLTCGEENKGAVAAVAEALHDKMTNSQTRANFAGYAYYGGLAITAIRAYEKWVREENG